MITPRHNRLNYVQSIFEHFPYTLFQWWYFENGELKPTKHRVFNDINPIMYLRKDKMLRTTLFNETSDELRLDFDNVDLNENLDDMKKVISKLIEWGVHKYECYESGGKGTHLKLRFNNIPFKNFDRQEVREVLFNTLNVNAKVDRLLFRTQQMIGLEGYNHRKTNKPKLRLIVDDDNLFNHLDQNLNFEYLKDDFVNNLDSKLIQRMLDVLENKNTSQIKPYKDINKVIKKKTKFNEQILFLHLDRFVELHLNDEIVRESKNRFSDMVTRYIWLTTKDELTSKMYMKYIFGRLDFKIDIDERFYLTIKYMKSNAIFLYKDLLSKQKFYETIESKLVTLKGVSKFNEQVNEVSRNE